MVLSVAATLVNSVVKDIIERVLSLEDISEESAVALTATMTILKDQCASLFPVSCTFGLVRSAGVMILYSSVEVLERGVVMGTCNFRLCFMKITRSHINYGECSHVTSVEKIVSIGRDELSRLELTRTSVNNR